MAKEHDNTLLIVGGLAVAYYLYTKGKAPATAPVNMSAGTQPVTTIAPVNNPITTIANGLINLVKDVLPTAPVTQPVTTTPVVTTPVADSGSDLYYDANGDGLAAGGDKYLPPVFEDNNYFY